MNRLKLSIVVCFLILTNISVLGGSVEAKITSNTTSQVFSTNVLVSTSKLYPQHVEPTMALGPNNQIFVGWKDADTATGSGVDVSFTKSVNNGDSWTNPVQMPYNYSADWSKSDAWMNYFNNTLYYSYLEYNFTAFSYGLYNKPYSQVTMAISSDNGSTWTTTQASHNKGFADKETFIVSPQGTIYLAYDDIINNIGLVTLAKSTNNGKSFSDISVINNISNGNIIAPYLAISSNNTLFASWTQYNTNNYGGNIMYDHSGNGGVNFTKNIALNPGTYVDYSGNNEPPPFPVMKFDSHDRLYILWDANENNSLMKVYLRYSDDFGLHWSNAIPIDSTPNTKQWEPDFAIDSQNNLHIAWLEANTNQFRPYYRELNFTGTNRSTINMSPIIPVADSYTPTSFTRPGDYLTIRVDSNDISHVVWTDGRSGSLNIYYAHSIVMTNSQSTNQSKTSPGFPFFMIFATLPSYILIKKRIHKHS